MKIIIAEVGEFAASDHDAELLGYYAEHLPGRGPRELLQILYLCRCVDFAAQSQTRRSTGLHVSANDLLTVAPLAALNVFGEEGRKWLRALGLGSSGEFGREVFRLVADGVLAVRENDRIQDFDVQSALDDFTREPNT
ncbi:MAG TPA: hypothetical protein VIK52_07215 [Opitutaceae bacterium]